MGQKDVGGKKACSPLVSLITLSHDRQLTRSSSDRPIHDDGEQRHCCSVYRTGWYVGQAFSRSRPRSRVSTGVHSGKSEHKYACRAALLRLPRRSPSVHCFTKHNDASAVATDKQPVPHTVHFGALQSFNDNALHSTSSSMGVFASPSWWECAVPPAQLVRFPHGGFELPWQALPSQHLRAVAATSSKTKSTACSQARVFIQEKLKARHAKKRAGARQCRAWKASGRVADAGGGLLEQRAGEQGKSREKGPGALAPSRRARNPVGRWVSRRDPPPMSRVGDPPHPHAPTHEDG